MRGCGYRGKLDGRAGIGQNHAVKEATEASSYIRSLSHRQRIARQYMYFVPREGAKSP
jgi:hypothetical protein